MQISGIPGDPKQYNSFGGFRENIGVCKTAIERYFWIHNEKFDNFGSIMSKSSFSEKNIFVIVQYLAQLRNYKYLS